jgi:2-oxoglutarate ferredoxin oxidoreductase subunit gamma
MTAAARMFAEAAETGADMALTEIRIGGFGGQGVILAANIIGKAASIFAGGYATMTQNYGPEARGGAASSALVLSDQPVLYPYITRPDILVVMSQEAYTRFSSEVKANGILIVEQDLVRVGPLPETVRLFSCPATRMAEELGKKVVLNVVMIGCLAAVSGILTKEAFRAAIEASVPKAAIDFNLRAFEAGYEYGLKKNGLQESVEADALATADLGG